MHAYYLYFFISIDREIIYIFNLKHMFNLSYIMYNETT